MCDFQSKIEEVHLYCQVVYHLIVSFGSDTILNLLSCKRNFVENNFLSHEMLFLSQPTR